MNKDFTKAEIIEIILHNKEAEKFYKYKNSQIKSKRNKALLKKFLIVGIVILFFFITFKWLKSNKNVTEKFSIFPTNSDSQGNSKVSQSKAENSINQFLTRTENTPLAPSPSTLTQLLQPTTFQVHASNNVTHTTQAPINNAEAEWPTSFISETRYNQQLSDSLEQLLENSHLHADLRAVAIEPCRNGLPIDRLTKNGNSFLNMLEYELEMGMVIGIEPRANWV